MEIQAEAPGLSPEQVEIRVTQTVAVAGLPGLATLRSSSIQGPSIIIATFEAGNGIHRARQPVTELLADLAGRVPQGGLPPTMYDRKT